MRWWRLAAGPRVSGNPCLSSKGRPCKRVTHSKTNMVEGMLTWLPAQSGESDREGIIPSKHRQWEATFSHPFTHFSADTESTFTHAPLSLVLNTQSHTDTHRYTSEDITLIKSCSSDEQFLIHLIVFDRYFKDQPWDSLSEGLAPWRHENDLIVWAYDLFFLTLICLRVSVRGMPRSRSMRLSRGTHLALCGCNEHEQAASPEKIRRLQCVCVFPSDRFWTSTGTRPGIEAVIQNQHYVTPCRWRDPGSSGSWRQPPPHVNWHWPTGSHLSLACAGLNDSINSVDYRRLQRFSDASAHQCENITILGTMCWSRDNKNSVRTVWGAMKLMKRTIPPIFKILVVLSRKKTWSSNAETLLWSRQVFCCF